ncbi:MAG: protein kinase [Pirellulaceae bacterium]
MRSFASEHRSHRGWPQHARGLIHRDIKPDNIWMEGDSQRIKILDFGLARMTEDEVNLTQSGTVLGTPKYMSPEQATGGRVDHRSDLFSLGSVLYHLVSGKPPFGGKNLPAMLIAVSRAQATPIDQLMPDIHPSLAALIHALMQRDPNDRPQSAAEVADRLSAIQISTHSGTFAPVVAKTRKSTATQGDIAVLEPAKVTSFKRGSFSKWFIGAVSLAMISIVIAASVIFVQLPDGTTLRVEIKDPEIEVAVKGTQIVLRKEGQTETSIEPGKQTLIVSRGPGLKFEVNKLIVKEGQQAVVTVSIVNGTVAVKQGDDTLHSQPMPPTVSPKSLAGANTVEDAATRESLTTGESDRAFATWPEGPGRLLTLKLDDEQITINGKNKLPTEPFKILSLVFHAHHGRAATQEDLDRLFAANLDSLQTVGFQYQTPPVEWIEMLHEHMPYLTGLHFATRDEYLKAVSRFQNLTNLQVSGNADRWAEMLSNKPSITNLYIQMTLTTDGFEHLAKLPNLTHLKLAALNNQTIAALVELPSLTHLTIDAPEHAWQVTDENLLQLAKLKRLESLIFHRPGTVDPTPLGMLLPKCEITYKFDGKYKTVTNTMTPSEL